MTTAGNLIVFVRAPVPGQVKTRLAPALTPKRIAALYRAFVMDVLETAGRLGHPITVAYCPPEAQMQIRGWLGGAYRYRPQAGADLGQRMASALGEAFAAGHRWALLLGTDLPDLPAAHLEQASREVDRMGAVLGPAGDGGYGLIGFRADRFTPQVFEKIAWGRATVLDQTLKAFRTAAVPVHQLAPWPDVDTPADLSCLHRRLKAHPASAPHTRACFKAWNASVKR